MKKDLLTVKELAAELRMSPKSIQRAYRTKLIPYERLCKLYFFDLEQVRRVMRQDGLDLTESR